MGLDYTKLEEILSKIRTVKYGDYVLAEDHNYQTDAIRELKKLLSDLEALTPKNIDDLQDVEIVSPSDGEVLTYESATGKWKNKSPPAMVIPRTSPFDPEDALWRPSDGWAIFIDFIDTDEQRPIFFAEGDYIQGAIVARHEAIYPNPIGNDVSPSGVGNVYTGLGETTVRKRLAIAKKSRISWNSDLSDTVRYQPFLDVYTATSDAYKYFRIGIDLKTGNFVDRDDTSDVLEAETWDWRCYVADYDEEKIKAYDEAKNIVWERPLKVTSPTVAFGQIVSYGVRASDGTVVTYNMVTVDWIGIG